MSYLSDKKKICPRSCRRVTLVFCALLILAFLRRCCTIFYNKSATTTTTQHIIVHNLLVYLTHVHTIYIRQRTMSCAMCFVVTQKLLYENSIYRISLVTSYCHIVVRMLLWTAMYMKNYAVPHLVYTGRDWTIIR